MLFYSFEFLYFFLPATVIGYYTLATSSSHKFSTYYLAVCSLVFYGWWDYKYLSLIIISIVFNYYIGLTLRQRRKKHLLIASIAANLFLIGYFKYAGFFAQIVNYLADSNISFGKIILPLAISFFTFQQIAWLLDNYSGKIEQGERSFVDYCLFVLFFPQLIAGPIVHHAEMMPQFKDRNNLRFQPENFTAGISIFVLGLSKKVIIADNLAPIANVAFSTAADDLAMNFVETWIGALAYTGQLYFDFSGYADMAIGLALMFNIRLPLNFNSPYKSRSITEFWRRWHMTLSRFLRDYIYIPLGGNRKGSYFRHQNLMITMLLGGLWHGANWNFVFWGALHGAFLVINHLWSTKSSFKIPPFIACLLTFICVVYAWVFFRAATFDAARLMVSSMSDVSSFSLASISMNYTEALYIVAALTIAFFFPNTQQLMSRMFSPIDTYYTTRDMNHLMLLRQLNSLKIGWNKYSLAFLSFLAVSSILLLLDSGTINEFIYFQF